MTGRHLHIVSFNIPYPPDYGGVMDVFFKLKALYEQGIRVTLHCYQYGRKEASELNNYCDQVYYYKRITYKNPFTGRLPYIVSTRASQELLERLMEDEDPILFEGLHTCYFLNHPDLAGRIRFVRAHNIEHTYYNNLAKVEKNVFKQLFFKRETRRLKIFEKEFSESTRIAAISPKEHDYFSKSYGNSFYLPVFHPNEEINIQVGMGQYALYHGNLGVGENREAAFYLLNQIFNDITDIPLIIAGKNPPRELIRLASNYPNVQIWSKVSTREIFRLISNAQVNILPTFQDTGIKLKLINVLYRGRHALVNSKMVKSTGLEDTCVIADTPKKMKENLRRLFGQEFSSAQIEKREAILSETFNNRKNASLLIREMFN